MLLALILHSTITHARVCARPDSTRDIAALGKLLPTPPCQLPKSRTPLEVVMIGENHYLEIAKQTRETGVERGARGDLAFLSETSPRGALLQSEIPSWVSSRGGDTKRPALVGLESSPGISLLIAYAIRSPRNSWDEARALRLLRQYAPHSPLLRDAIANVKPDNADDPLAVTDFEKQIYGDGEIEPPDHVARYVNKVVAATLALAGTKYAAQLDGGTWPDTPYGPGDPDYTPRHSRLMAIRDRDFARTAGREICGLARQFSRVFVNVGDAHAEALRQHLNADFGASITLRYLDQSKPDEAALALKLLRDQ